MRRKRDSQRSKVYRAESKHSGRRDIRFAGLRDVHEWLNRITNERWFRNRWPGSAARILASGKPMHRWQIKDGRGTRHARGGYHYMNLPQWARCKLVILHEMAHGLCNTYVAAHGRLFCRTLLELVRYAMGRPAADELKRLFREHGVKWHKRQPGRKPSPAALAALRRYREAKKLAAAERDQS